METSIKVVKEFISKWDVIGNIDDDSLAMKIQEQESMGWSLISSFAANTTGIGKTDTIVFIYRKK